MVFLTKRGKRRHLFKQNNLTYASNSNEIHGWDRVGTAKPKYVHQKSRVYLKY